MLPDTIDGKPVAVDLGSGLGGWVIGLRAAGYYVVAIDIKDFSEKNPAHEFWVADVSNLVGRLFRNARVIVSSAPCQPFSCTNTNGGRDPDAGMILVAEFLRVIREALDSGVPFWAMENVPGSVKHISRLLGPPRLRSYPWFAWGNFPSFLMSHSNRMYKGKVGKPYTRLIPADGRVKTSIRNVRKKGNAAAMIPFPIAHGIAEACLP
ncbi:MAG: DNA cytosine methyltransferase [Euryarchaeota archaeon]|nr:DNA cytosine methyltransferase [Euryarchaeota archaeon]